MTNEQKFTTVEERHKAFNRFCKDYECKNCPLMYMGASSNTCVFNWLTLEAEEEMPMPCPFCGGETQSNLGHLKVGDIHYWVDCISPDCMYRSAHYTDKKVAIAAHNRVCRAVRAYKESEVAE